MARLPAEDVLNSEEAKTWVSESTQAPRHVPLVAHIIYRLDVGGLENGLVNIINGIPEKCYRHVLICLTEYTDFRLRIKRQDVQFFALKKGEGKGLGVYVKLWRLLRKLHPDIAHTRNLAGVDCAVIAAFAGVPHRVHGEHGKDMLEIHGDNRKYNLLRRLCKPFVHTYIAVSHNLSVWLRDRIGVPERKITQIYNGVDIGRFYPAHLSRAPLPIADFASSSTIVIGTVGRLAAVKDPVTLVRAFIRLLELVPAARKELRLVLVGDGSLRPRIETLLDSANATDIVWLAGKRDDVPELLRGFDIFVLPSLTEGISNTILEAMATALPVVATKVGGTPELVIEGVTGTLVPPSDVDAMAHTLKMYIEQPDLRHKHGRAGRVRVEREFDIARMVSRYQSVYDALVMSRTRGKSSYNNEGE
jgi:sugar transferase (PEP-CTERM/EpsH1 system associated)